MGRWGRWGREERGARVPEPMPERAQHKARSTGRGAWGVGRGARGAGRGAWGVGRGCAPPLEGQHSAEQHKGEHPERPHVHCLAVALAR
jgi:hypothetical protein